MRTLLAILFIAFTKLVPAQDWALLNPAYRYNYNNDGTDTISNQIRVMGVDTLGVDSIRFALNRVARPCVECPPPCNVQVELPQFLGSRCLRDGQTWTFNDPTELVIKPHAQVGEQWIFRPSDGTLCTVDLYTVMLGVEDSVKRLTSALGDTVVWSKQQGLIYWHVQGASSYSLVGINGAGVGRQVPTLADFFPYQPGDVVEFVDYQQEMGHATWTYRKVTIASRTETSDQIILNGPMLYRWQHSSGNVETEYDANYTWYIDEAHMPMLRLLSSAPQQYVGPGTVCEPSPRQHEVSLIARHGLDASGNYIITTDNIGPITLFFPIDTVNEQCMHVTGFGFQQENMVLFRENFGLVLYSGHFGFTNERFYIQGARINGVEQGVLDPDDYFYTGITDDLAGPGLMLHPNPADDRLSLQLPLIRSGMWQINSITGQVVAAGWMPATDKPSFDVSALSPGVYMLTLTGDDSRSSGRFIIAR